MDNPSFGARGRHRTPQEIRAGVLHVVRSRSAADDETLGARYPERPSLHLAHSRTPQGRANRRDWWFCWVIIPVLLAVAAVVAGWGLWR